MNEPLVSIMMILYNNVQYLKNAVNSVLAQTYTNWELIINDDCSTDGSWELAQKLAETDPRIKVFQNKTNLMTPKNRAAAMTHMSGELVAHLDSDDALYPHSVETMVKYMAAHPKVDLMYSDMAVVDPKGKIESYNRQPDESDNLAFHGWRHFGMYRMSAYKQIDGFNTKLTGGCEDGDLFMQIVERGKGKFLRIPHVLYQYRSHGENTSLKNYKCDDCPDRPVCNYVRVWCKHAGFDPVTFTSLKKETA